jgi:hypothetical protein
VVSLVRACGQEISYSELKEDFERIRGKTIDKLSKLPKRLDEKNQGLCYSKNEKELLDKLS